MSANWWSEIAYATLWSMPQFAMQSFWWIWICALSAVVYFLKDWLEETYDRMERLRLRLDIMEKAMGEVEGDIVTICRNMRRDIEEYDGAFNVGTEIRLFYDGFGSVHMRDPLIVSLYGIDVNSLDSIFPHP